MKQFIKMFLSASRLERIGILFLITVCTLSLLYPYLHRLYSKEKTSDFSAVEKDYGKAFPNGNNPNSTSEAAPSETSLFYFDPNTASLEDLLRLGLNAKTSKSIVNYRSKGGQFRKPEDFKKIYTLSESDYQRLLPYISIGGARAAPPSYTAEGAEPAQIAVLTPFDPNIVSESELLKMGLPKRTIHTWINYRSKGGKFRYKEDVAKLYALEDDDYQRIAPYIELPGRMASADAPQPNTYNNGGLSPQYGQKRTIQRIDINTAGLDDWTQLPGIGTGWAQRILNFRDKLGGFVSVAQVAETRGLPDSIFQKANPYLDLRSAIFRPILVNTATKEELSKHPYVDFKVAQMIALYRERYGRFQKADDLIKVPEVKIAWLEKVRPYIRLE